MFSLAIENIFNIMSLLAAHLSACLISVLLRISSVPISSRLLHTLLSGSVYLTFGLCPWSIWSCILCKVININLFAFFHLLPSGLTNPIDQSVYLWILYKKSDIHRYMDYVWVSNSIPLVNVSSFIPVSCCFYCSVVHFETRYGDISSNSFISQDYFSYPVFFVCVSI